MASNNDYNNWLEHQRQTSSRQGYQPQQAPPRKGRDKRRRSPSPATSKRCRRDFLPPPPPPPPPPPVHSRLGQLRYGPGKEHCTPNFGLLGNRMAMARHLNQLFEDVDIKADTVTLGGSVYSYFNLKTAAKLFEKRGNQDGSTHPWIATKMKHIMSNPDPKETATFLFQTALRSPMQACTIIEVNLEKRFENLSVSQFDIDCLCTNLAAVLEDEVHKSNRDHTANHNKLLKFNASSKIPKIVIQVHLNGKKGMEKIIAMMSTEWSVKLTHSTTVAFMCCIQKMFRSKGYRPDENQYAKFPLHYIDVETGTPTTTPGIIPFWMGYATMMLNHRMCPRKACMPAVFGDSSMKDVVTATSIICTSKSAASFINAIQRGVHKGSFGTVNLDLTKPNPCTAIPYKLQHDCYRNGFILKEEVDEPVVRKKLKPKAARATKSVPVRVEEVEGCISEDADECNSSSSSSQLPPSPVFPVVMDDEIPTREESSDDERDEEHPKEERSPKRQKRSLRNSRSEREESSSDEEEDGEIEPRKRVSKPPKKNESENSSSSSSSSSSDEEDDKKSTGSQSGSGSSSSSSGSSSSSSDSESEDEKKDVAEKTPPQEERPQSDSEQEDESVPMAETAAPDVIKNDSHTSDTQSVPTIVQEAVPGIVEQSQTAAQALAELVEQVTQSTTFAVDDTAADTTEPMDVEQHQQMDFMDLEPPPTPSFDMIPGLGFDDEYDFEMPDISTSMLEDILSMASKNNTK